jgi:alcohol dehydrogenase
MTGYESVGEVLACGAAVGGLAPGDRVVASYGHRTHAVVTAARAIVVPAAIDDRLALLSILACDAAKGVGKLSAPPAAPVLISGGGTIGLLALFNLRARGYSAVDLIEPQPARRGLALRLGARRAIDPADQAGLALLDGGYAAGVECSSRDAAFALLQRQVRPGGQICVLADGNLEPLLLQPEFHSRELMIVGSSDGIDYPGYAAWLWARLLRADAPPLGELFEAEVAAMQLAEAFLALADQTSPPLKVLVRYAGW